MRRPDAACGRYPCLPECHKEAPMSPRGKPARVLPITAAAITLSSASVPIELVPAPSRAVVMTAATAASPPIQANTPSVTLRTSMPASAAAAGLPPIAKT